jgi:hypothetical protein
MGGRVTGESKLMMMMMMFAKLWRELDFILLLGSGLVWLDFNANYNLDGLGLGLGLALNLTL